MSEVNNNFMQNYAFDITNRYADQNKVGKKEATSTDSLNGNDRKDVTSTRDPSGSLTFEDMLLLMVTQLQNQGIDSSMDTKDMMNQIIQMTVMQSLTEVSQQVEEMTLANVMNYASSLVGKEVTLGVYDEKGNVKEIYGKVEAAGTYDGQQVIFVDGQSYFLSSIMAVGKLPPTQKPGDTDKPDGAEKPGDTDKPDGAEKPDDTEKPGEAGKPDGSGGDNTGTDNGGTDAARYNVNGTWGI